jgi:hypothetical protein
VFEKSITNRPTVVREIQTILAQNKFNPDLQSSNQLALGEDPTAKRKLNIFDH